MAKIKKIQEGGATIYPATITNAVKDPETGKTLPELLGDGVQSNGTYPKMTAGFAQEFVGDGSATPEEFSFRPTAGEDRNVANTTYYDGERNGVARIEKIKGNSVVANNCMGGGIGQNGYIVTKYEDGSFSVKRNPEITSGLYFSDWFLAGKTFIGHKYAFIINYVASNILEGELIDVYFYNITTSQYGPKIKKNGEGTSVVIVTCNNVSSRPYISYGPNKEEELLVKSRYAIDLTKMFGVGNEPTTVEELYQRLPKGIDLSQYDEGRIIDGNYEGIKTVGFNAFNGTYAKVCAGCSYYLGGNYISLGFTTEEGGTTEAIALPTSTESVGTTPSDRLYTPSQNGYIYAEGENININLSWDTEYGYLNGTYQPYKPFERDLSWVAKYFPATINEETKYGMRSIGSVRDEIRFNSTTQKWEAVQRVGVVDLGSLSWETYAYTSDNTVYVARNNNDGSGKSVGLSTKYSLHTGSVASMPNLTYFMRTDYPKYIYICDNSYSTLEDFVASVQGMQFYFILKDAKITEITEDINMDFDVSDYGTEELIVEDGVASAPIVADISYAPNALSTLKQVPDILKRLKALESAVASATATTNEEETVE